MEAGMDNKRWICMDLKDKIESKVAIFWHCWSWICRTATHATVCRSGYKVIGFDINPGKVDTLKHRGTYIEHIPREFIAEAASHRFEATCDFSMAMEVDGDHLSHST
jgi:UDP-glucose 6-dehydrogenase